MALSAEDRDLIARTALGESGDPTIQAQIVRDILAAGDNPADLVLSRGRFKSWDNPRGQFKIDPSSDQFKKVAQLVDSASASDASAPSAPKPGSVLEQFGFNADGTPKANVAKTPTKAPDHEPGSVLKLFGHDINAPEQPAKVEIFPPGAKDYLTIPGSGAKQYVDEQGQFLPVPSYQGPNALARAGEFVGELPGRYGAATSQAFQSAKELAGSGMEDIRARRYFPTTPSADPRTWTGGGLLKTAAGLVGEPFSLLTGALNVGAEEVNKLTGVPGTGEKLAFLAPGPKVVRTAKEMAPSVNALNRVVEDIGAENIPKVAKRLQSNPTLSLMDVAPGVQTRAIAIAKGEPSAGQTTLFDEAARRTADRRNQTTQAFGTTIGPSPNTVALLDEMQTMRREAGSGMINPALASAKPVNITDVVKDIDRRIGAPAIAALKEGRPLPQLSPIQQRLLELRQELSYTPEGNIIHPEREEFHYKNMPATSDPLAGAPDVGVHGVQSRLRSEADTLLRSASGSDRIMGGALMDVRGKLVDAIDAAAGGKYKPGLAAYHEAMRVPEAFIKGMDIASGARTGEAGLANRPEAWQAWFSGLSEAEQNAARLGARTAIDNHIGTIRQAGRAGADIPDAPFTRAKIEMMFGKDETDRLVQLLSDEKAKAETNTLLTRQSVTARAQAAQKETTPRTVEPVAVHAQRLLPAAVLEAVQAPFTGLPGLGTLGLMAYGGVRKGAQKIGRARDIASNNAYARIASTTSPEERHVILNALRARATPIGHGNKFTNALARMSTLPLPR